MRVCSGALSETWQKRFGHTHVQVNLGELTDVQVNSELCCKPGLYASTRDRICGVLKSLTAMLAGWNELIDERFVCSGDLDIQAAEVVGKLFGCAGTENDRRDVRVGQTPSQCELSDRQSALVAMLAQLLSHQ